MVDRQKPISCSRMLSFDGCDASYRSHIACDDLSSSSSGVHPLTEDFKADESGICGLWLRNNVLVVDDSFIVIVNWIIVLALTKH